MDRRDVGSRMGFCGGGLMSRYSNRTMKRAQRFLAYLIELGPDDRATDRLIDRVGALMDAVDQEQESHRRKREELLQRLRDEMDRHPEVEKWIG